MASSPDRGAVTTLLEELLEAEGFKAADMVAPTDAGWQEEMHAGGSDFIPYVVITPQTSTPGTGGIGDGSMDWDLPYTLTAYGVNRRQVEDLADDVRRIIINKRRIDIPMKDSKTWRLTSVTCTSIGGVGIKQNIVPNAFSQSDSIQIKLSRNL